jgi:hyperosmotically inducible protein
MDVRDVTRLDLWPNGIGGGYLRPALRAGALLAGLLTSPLFAQSIQPSAAPPQSSVEQGKTPDSKSPAKPQKAPSPAQSSSQDSKPAQSRNQTAKGEEPKTKGEEEAETNEAAKKTVSSLILTVKLALLADPQLFPYEIEVEATSNNITLLGKVSAEEEKTAAANIASAVPTIKSVTNNLEVNKELREVLARKQDDIITHYVKERFARSATITAANFDVKTEQGIVFLSGTVRFQVIVLEAAEAVRQIPGVKAVKTDKVRIESEG